jgi:hypothetical protein
MPRVVGNRRLRTGGIALATMLLAFGAALSGIALLSVAKTSAYLGVKQDVPVGSVVQASDLTSVQLSGGSGLTLIPAADLRQVIGKHAAVELRPGTLLSPTELNDQPLATGNQAQMGIVVNSTLMPQHLAVGQKVILLPLGASASSTNRSGGGTAASTAPTTDGGYEVTVLAVSAPNSGGSVAMQISVDPSYALTIAQLNSGGWNVTSVTGN